MCCFEEMPVVRRKLLFFSDAGKALQLRKIILKFATFVYMSGFTPLRIQREILCRASVTSYDNYISGEINYQQTR